MSLFEILQGKTHTQTWVNLDLSTKDCEFALIELFGITQCFTQYKSCKIVHEMVNMTWLL